MKFLMTKNKLQVYIINKIGPSLETWDTFNYYLSLQSMNECLSYLQKNLIESPRKRQQNIIRIKVNYD